MKKLAKAGIGLAAVAAISAAGIVAVNAWGPERKTFTMEKPADYVTFNSITIFISIIIFSGFIS